MTDPSRYSSGTLEPPEVKESPFKRYSKLRIIKNLVVLSIGIHLLLTAYNGLAMLQSTMNREEGIGVISQAVAYIFCCVSAVLFPKYVIKKLGSQSAFAFSMLSYLPYVASNFYSQWALMMPASILIGLGAAIQWGAMVVYFNDISLMYSELIMDTRQEAEFTSIYGAIHENSLEMNHSESLKRNREFPKQQEETNTRQKLIESTSAWIFGFHGVAYLSSDMTSNLMTYFILQSEVGEGSKSNSSCTCGADYCNVESTCFENNIATPSDEIRYILTAVCVCIGVVSVIIVFLFLDTLETKKEKVSFSMDLLMATCKLIKKKKLLLLTPLSLYLGMMPGFFAGDFNKSYVGCAWGTYHVGLVAFCYGAISGISSFSSGCLVKRLGRIPLFIPAALVNLGTNVFLLMWNPSADEPQWFFVGAGLLGLFNGVIWSQLIAFYGVLFKADEEAAFSAFYVWYCLGFTLSFGYSNYICTYVKIYILIAVCILGFLGYLTVEIMHLKNKAKN